MRRLSFFSPPSRAAAAPPRLASRSFSASEHDRPRTFDLLVRCEASQGQWVSFCVNPFSNRLFHD
jgi:hypothetical protein